MCPGPWPCWASTAKPPARANSEALLGVLELSVPGPTTGFAALLAHLNSSARNPLSSPLSNILFVR